MSFTITQLYPSNIEKWDTHWGSTLPTKENINSITCDKKENITSSMEKLYPSNIGKYNIKHKKENLIKKPFYKISLEEIYENILITIKEIYPELVELFKSNDNLNINKYINIFSKNNRLLYSGIFLIIISFVFMI